MKVLGINGVFKNIIYFFDFDHEGNLPTFYSSLALLSSGLLLFIISYFHKTNRLEHFQWKGLAFIFVFLSIDEITMIHEQLWMPTHKLFNTTGLLYYAWYIPYGILLLILLFIYSKFLMRLPKKIRWLFILSGFVFVFGAIGIESVSGYYDELHGQENLVFYIICTVEELFEMVGVAIFIYALLLYISDTIEHIDLKSTELLN
ncbi:hypothetical protein [Robiginitalea aurantiaca]|uniref:Multidrug transporter n=1 Tax=Robiginitalea aurantiaca TaxID=3056915 RepID=A0ABT7WBL4_9FLAO|nr:hypothetical protein [Robiginitalea aurantiaca]MDM9630304.1 hypothetical protein [Robiginitalea aurantiaca]